MAPASHCQGNQKMAWTTARHARLCENWWTRLRTLAQIIWTLLHSYLS